MPYIVSVPTFMALNDHLGVKQHQTTENDETKINLQLKEGTRQVKHRTENNQTRLTVKARDVGTKILKMPTQMSSIRPDNNGPGIETSCETHYNMSNKPPKKRK